MSIGVADQDVMAASKEKLHPVPKSSPDRGHLYHVRMLLGACRKLRSSPGEASFSRPGEAQGRPKRENPHYIIFVLHAHWADLTAEGSDSGVTIKA
jgi:hypothetical protein